MNGVMACLVLAVPIIVSLAAFGEPILKLWLGSVPPKTYEIMIALGIVNALQLPGHQCFLFLTGVGRNRQLVGLAVIGAVVNLGGTIAATYWLGPIGPAIGSIPVVLVLDFTVLPIMVCRYIGIPVGQYVRLALGPVVPVGLAAGAVALALVHLHPAHTGVAAIVASVVTCAVAWAVFALVLAKLEPELRAAIWQRLQRLRRRRA
jgi:O-antigen/teichoic acid export membrane protein